MDVTLSEWIGTGALIIGLLTVDLVIGGRRGRAPTAREAAVWVAGYCSVAVAFAGLVLVRFGPEHAGAFVAGWVTEYSLSVDNLFVFLVLMSRFAVPVHLQLYVLTVGILLALVLRGLLIVVGAAVIARYTWVFAIFGVFLFWTAWGLLRGGVAGEADAEPNAAVRWLERVLPTTRQWHGPRLTARVAGRRVLTPMLVTLVAFGMTDVLFALDSIPAIFGLTREPFLVVAANAFALMGLRQLYFLVQGLVQKLPLLGTGLAVVLGFIGVKLVLEALHENTLPFVNGGNPIEGLPRIPVTVSLAVIVGALAISTVAGVIGSRRGEPSGERDVA